MVIIKIILFILSFSSFAFDKLEMKASKTYGVVRLSITKIADKVGIDTNSNSFGSSKAFGSYKTDLASEILSKELKKIKDKMKKIDSTLMSGGSSLNKLYPTSGHEMYIVLDDYIVSQKNPYYESLRVLIEKVFDAKKIKTFKEITLVEDKLTINTNGELKVELFDRHKYCEGSALNAICKIKEDGFMSL